MDIAGGIAHVTGDRMRTPPTPSWNEDHAMLDRWGLSGMKSFETPRMAVDEHVSCDSSSSCGCARQQNRPAAEHAEVP